MRQLRFFAFLVWATASAAGGALAAEEMTALARPDPAKSEIADFGDNLQVTLTLSQPVPWRVFTLDEPARLIFDFAEVDFTAFPLRDITRSDMVAAVAAGPVTEGWSRLVVELSGPMMLETAGLATGSDPAGAVLKAQLAPTSAESFADSVGEPDTPGFDLPDAAEVAPNLDRWQGDRPLVVALDPGHGGIDPGAEAGEVHEADLMLTFALELREVLQKRGLQVVLTRDADVFVPLETRVSIAREAGADLFMSLHADAIAEGHASGATVYTLSDTASDAASRKLAERHDRADLLAGLDLSDQDDVVADVLMDLAMLETTPRSDALADAIVRGLADSTGNLHKRPRLSAGFSVLKAPDIPSVLVELGFLSSPRDRAKLRSEPWRARAAEGIASAIDAWAEADAELRPRLRH
ncbi:N-acetylmuramoyl-L-alanine amidase [Mesobaculum littorinae]|uniref:N-acetylmuramoyl-L-alanine amidase n=2 Tax=Mesobaculum littorinae TaxID=2486419 RepID=A0A438AN74_9RHOB|nr:N-acetylmuramoyl-L-alanine amidase [Mesobaculum littorinae]